MIKANQKKIELDYDFLKTLLFSTMGTVISLALAQPSFNEPLKSTVTTLNYLFMLILIIIAVLFIKTYCSLRKLLK